MRASNIRFSVVEGLGAVASAEVMARTGVSVRPVGMVRGTQILATSGEMMVGDAMKLRTVEDAFVFIGDIALSGQIFDLKQVERSALWGKPLQRALTVWSAARDLPLVKRLAFRVVVQADDAKWQHYRRSDVGLAAERGLMGAGTSWRLHRDEAPLEIWLQQAGKKYMVSIRLTTTKQRQHGGRDVEREAALRPSVAASLVWLSEPRDDDVFLDPMCGSGTILLERAVMGRYRKLEGGDIDPAAVQATLANFGARHQPREIQAWDATRLPLSDQSVNVVACNLPWGRKVSELTSLPSLYAGFLTEAERVLQADGRMVLLTSEWDILKKALAARRLLRVVRVVHDVHILGRRADIFVVVRNHSS